MHCVIVLIVSPFYETSGYIKWLQRIDKKKSEAINLTQKQAIGDLEKQ
jgi:hypothetical protein